jgi:maltose-binding protein MalE
VKPPSVGIVVFINCVLITYLCLFQLNGLFALGTPMSEDRRENVTLRILFDEFNRKGMGKSLVDNALDKLRSNHPGSDIEVQYIDTPYSETKEQITKAITNGTPIDVISMDQIWLGELADKGLLMDLTEKAEEWGRLSDFYQSNLDGMIYNNSVYGIWAWTDVRGIWYWKDLLEEANVEPHSLKTWDGYIAAAKQLNSVFRPEGIEGVHLTGANHSIDLWYPYLFILLIYGIHICGCLVESRSSKKKVILQEAHIGFLLSTAQKVPRHYHLSRIKSKQE